MQMETDPPSSDYSDQEVSIQEERISSQTRSYDCTYCKKGFSNAQALGGHMNIHRRDRLKYKQPSKDNQIPIDLTAKKIPSYPPIPSLQPESTMENRSCATIKWPWVIPSEDGGSRDGTCEVDRRQLPLFIDTLAGDDDRQLGVHGTHEESTTPSISDSGGEQLDLELRLGPEPPQDTSNGLKEFL